MAETALNWNDAQVFLAIARAGALSPAARTLGIGAATASRRIARLEAALKTPLFQRSQSGYRLTDDGAALLPRAEALEDAMARLVDQAEAAAAVEGTVRVATAENLANPILIPSLASLANRHPRLSVEILTNVATVNLHRRDADLAIRMTRPERGNLSLRRIGRIGFGLYAARSYLEARAADGAEDRYIGWAEPFRALPAAQWVEKALGGRAPSVATTTLAGQMAAAQAGLGLAVLPHFLAQAAGLIARDAAPGLDQSIWLVLHADLAASRRVRLVADHLAAAIEAHADLLRWGGPAPQ